MFKGQLVDAVVEVLKASGHSLTANDIRLRLNGPVTKSDINSVLYGELASARLVQKDDFFRWTLIGTQASDQSKSTHPAAVTVASRLQDRVAENDSRQDGRSIVVESGTPPTSPALSAQEFASIEAAVREELAAARESIKSTWLDIDAIEALPAAPGQFIYRLVLSTPVTLGPDQAITFQTRSPKDTIPAVIIRCDDEGLVVECEKPLPTEAKLLSLSFDPSFILRALEDFIVQLVPQGGQIARLVASKTLSTPPTVRATQRPGLNHEQSVAIDEMFATPLLLLWGPPGTGKTTTIGAAVVEWMRKNKTVLVVSTSNAAVDVAMKAVLKRTEPSEQRHLLRLGTSLDPVVRDITLGGKLAAANLPLAAKTQLAQRKLQDIREQLASRTLSHEQRYSLFAEAAKYEKQVSDFNEKVTAAAPQLASDVRVVGCTLAKMVLDHDLRNRRFDVVILDEASMASLLYGFAASLLAESNLVYAGDPKQLPPIVQAKGHNAAKWFGQNIYDWLGVEMGEEVAATKLSLLRTQYRMTDEIGGVVSRLMYGGLLKHGRSACGPRILFVDIEGEWQTTHYSVQEKSYYHLAAVPILHGLSDLFGDDELLLLSPFRPQRSMLAAVAFDLKRRFSQERRILASTIHRAQGSEARAVVVDLTTHSPQQLVAFFRDQHCAKLFNVAISRAKDGLVILGSRSLLQELAKTMPFWRRVISEFGDGMDVISSDEAIEDLDAHDEITAIPLFGTKGLPALYCHSRQSGTPGPGIEMLKKLEASRKLLVLPDPTTQVEDGDFIVRRSTNCPPVFVGGGHVCLPYRDRWIAVDSVNASRVLWRIGFSHLADDEVDPIQAKRFFCPECANGELVLQQNRGEGWFLVCNNGQVHECYYRRRISLEDAKLKVRLQGMRCPHDHPLTARPGPRSIFIGCENYPDCDFTESLSVLSGV
jgi:hypothetical protein